MTTTIDYHSLATAMSQLNDNSASILENGAQPMWDVKTEASVDRQHKAEIWTESRDTRHLLEHPSISAPAHQSEREIAKRIILLTQPNQDRVHVCGSQTLHEIWSMLLAK